MVKTVKRLFRKAEESNRSEQLTLLEWNNTATENENYSPSEKLFGRKSRTLLTILKKLLELRHETEEEKRRMKIKKEKQKHYYDRNIREYETILTHNLIEVDDKTYIRNRKDLNIVRNQIENEEDEERQKNEKEREYRNNEVKTRPQRERWLPDNIRR